MIISKIRGGLGNQLFQWSAGYALAKMHNVDHLLDLSVYSRNLVREFQLGTLSLPYKQATEEQIEEHKSTNFYRQLYYHYDPLFFNNTNSTFLRGYFCSQKYFQPTAEEIRSLLSNSLNKIELNLDQQQLLETINSNESISIHIRRGDYIENSEYRDFFGVCSLAYYEQAIEFITNKLKKKNIVFVIFSDDIDWVKNNLKVKNHQLIFAETNKGNESYLDMLFMAKCKHNIIANSTFSWWGAWINQYSEKIVIGPKKWFAKTYRAPTKGSWIQSNHYVTSDLFPSEWYSL